MSLIAIQGKRPQYLFYCGPCTYGRSPRLNTGNRCVGGGYLEVSVGKACKISALVLLTVSFAFAQNVSSSVRAVALDSTGATIPDAECNLTNQNTSTVLTVKTDSQ